MHKLFSTQRDEETIYLVIREHPVLIGIRLIFVVFLYVLGITMHILIPHLLPGFVAGIVSDIVNLLFFVYYLGLLLGGLLAFVYYYLSVQIITDMRMVDVDQSGLFGRKVTEIQIENVEEVTSTSHGVLPTLFNFGKVLVQTSSAMSEFVFENVAHPEQIKKLILDLYEQHRKNNIKQNPSTAKNNPDNNLVI